MFLGWIKLKNIFFTGRNLANWNPSLEFSSEGVSIASGWHSANNVFNYLGGGELNNQLTAAVTKGAADMALDPGRKMPHP